jgi:hypothetical protein
MPVNDADAAAICDAAGVSGTKSETLDGIAVAAQQATQGAQCGFE